MHGGGVGRLRFYSINQHRGASHHWLLNRCVVSSLVILGVGIRFYFKNLETVPFTNRTRFVIFPKLKENSFGEEYLEDMKEQMKHKVKIFPPDHPDSVRVRLIAEKIIGALHRELRKKRIWSAPQYDLGIWDSKCEGSLMALIGWWNAWKNGVLGDDWGGSSIKVSVESQTRFLESLNWEILVVSSGSAFCLMGGKLIFSTEYMKYLTTDAEIATIIGHEVGHAVARHMAEMVIKELWFFMYAFLIRMLTGNAKLAKERTDVLVRFPLSRRIETEADYIGRLLVASAGYDPCAAVEAHKKMGRKWKSNSTKCLRSNRSKHYLGTHPSGEERAEFLSRDQVCPDEIMRRRRSVYGCLEQLQYNTPVN
ncbi:hypothetical protein QJS10_CPB20g00980 [Acorus calamus]|uniref:Peptidase M48 domain-containing protein n=1 Tax=Acorus calamus TaxID=4465 RepID=A0AAV9CCC1_ACOCL|nr:hypothetical protein QJS10_CPB20g00980 [Acorus calamus]